MKLVVISPEAFDPRETSVLAELFAAGLERYHVRKPAVPRSALAAWLGRLPEAWRARIVLHQYHELVDTLGLGGRHERDVPENAAAAASRGPRLENDAARAGGAPALSGFVSRSCHDLAALRAALGVYDAVIFSPVFPSISKPGYGLRRTFDEGELAGLLASRPEQERRTEVIALGGVTPANIAECRALGFDGVAVLGAVWHAPDPVRAFLALKAEVFAHAH